MLLLFNTFCINIFIRINIRCLDFLVVSSFSVRQFVVQYRGWGADLVSVP